jgi:hypothetical protein
VLCLSFSCMVIQMNHEFHFFWTKNHEFHAGFLSSQEEAQERKLRPGEMRVPCPITGEPM